MTEHYKKARDAAQVELDQLLNEQHEISQRILKLKQTIATLDALSGTTPKPAALPRMTEAIRGVLMGSEHPLTATEVRDELRKSGFSLAKYSNPLASIHVVLKRLVAAGQAESGPRALGGQTQYIWKDNIKGPFWWLAGGKK